MLQDSLSPKNLSGRKRKLVDDLRADWDISIRRACQVIEFEDCPHGSIGHKPPISLLNAGDAASPSL